MINLKVIIANSKKNKIIYLNKNPVEIKLY